ncbi:MAG TPA: hypothetical protein VH257_04315, partial [Chloroflexota bacterium]|nr:hypothetical protein [Chloroflexota bacterium]
MVTAAPAAGAVPAERSPALSRRAGAVSALRRAWPWLAAVLVALAVGAGIAFAWLDPRFDYLVDDGHNHADRVGLFDALLRRDGASLYPRWWPDLSLGYGYPLLTFYSPGVYYLAEAAHVLGASTHRALPLVAFGTVLLGTSGAFTLGAVSFRSPLAALVLATTYVGAPYPFVTNLYNRSAFPEAMGLAVLPWLLVAGTLAVQRPGALTALALAFCLAALVLLHNLSALVGAAVLALWAGATLLDTPRAGDGWRGAAGGAVLGLLLCAFFWVPAIFERGAVHTSLGSSGVLSFGPWLFDPLRPGPVETAITVAERYRLTPGPIDLNLVYPHAPRNVPGPVKPGLAQGLFLLLSLAAGLSGWLEGRRPRRQRPPTARATDPREPWPAGLPMAKARIALCLALCALFWLLNTTWSRPLWEGLPPLAVLQFPWRLYGPLALALAFAGAGIFAWLAGRGQQQWILALLLATFVVVNGRAGHTRNVRQRDPDALPPIATRLHETEGVNTASGTTSGGEFLPRSVVLPDVAPPGWSWKVAYEALYPPGGWVAGRVWPVSEGVEVRQVWDTPQWTAAQVEVGGAAPAEVAFRTLVFPGWRAYVDGRPAPLHAAPYDHTVALGHGFAIVTVPPGVHDVQLALGPTTTEIAGTLLS